MMMFKKNTEKKITVIYHTPLNFIILTVQVKYFIYKGKLLIHRLIFAPGPFE